MLCQCQLDGALEDIVADLVAVRERYDALLGDASPRIAKLMTENALLRAALEHAQWGSGCLAEMERLAHVLFHKSEDFWWIGELLDEVKLLRAALERVMANACEGHFEGCQVKWGRHCDCGIDVARAALADAP